MLKLHRDAIWLETERFAEASQLTVKVEYLVEVGETISLRTFNYDEAQKAAADFPGESTHIFTKLHITTPWIETTPKQEEDDDQ